MSFVFSFFPLKVFLIVQLGGLNIQSKSAFWGFYIALHNLQLCIYLLV